MGNILLLTKNRRSKFFVYFWRKRGFASIIIWFDTFYIEGQSCVLIFRPTHILFILKIDSPKWNLLENCTPPWEVINDRSLSSYVFSFLYRLWKYCTNLCMEGISNNTHVPSLWLLPYNGVFFRISFHTELSLSVFSVTEILFSLSVVCYLDDRVERNDEVLS